MRYRVNVPFTGSKKRYKIGEILSESRVRSWKNLRALVASRYLEPIIEDDNNDTSNAKT